VYTGRLCDRRRLWGGAFCLPLQVNQQMDHHAGPPGEARPRGVSAVHAAGPRPYAANGRPNSIKRPTTPRNVEDATRPRGAVRNAPRRGLCRVFGADACTRPDGRTTGWDREREEVTAGGRRKLGATRWLTGRVGGQTNAQARGNNPQSTLFGGTKKRTFRSRAPLLYRDCRTVRALPQLPSPGFCVCFGVPARAATPAFRIAPCCRYLFRSLSLAGHTSSSSSHVDNGCGAADGIWLNGRLPIAACVS
jgi:hypothetical protein